MGARTAHTPMCVGSIVLMRVTCACADAHVHVHVVVVVHVHVVHVHVRPGHPTQCAPTDKEIHPQRSTVATGNNHRVPGKASATHRLVPSHYRPAPRRPLDLLGQQLVRQVLSMA